MSAAPLRRAWAAATRTTGRRVASAVVVVALVAAAVGGVVALGADEAPVAAGPGRPSTTTTTAPAVPTTAPPTLPAPPADGLRFVPEDLPANGSSAPLTGLPVADPLRLGRAAVAVKIDNLDVPGESARPQVGIAHADVVVEEVVEGGITRFVALLHSTDAPEVGPVRSARTTDVHLLPAFGAPLFAYSGGNPSVVAAVRGAPRIIDRGGEWAPAYVRVPGRPTTCSSARGRSGAAAGARRRPSSEPSGPRPSRRRRASPCRA